MKNISVIDAVYIAYKEMSDTFYFINIIKYVRHLRNQPDLTDGTISKKFRELRYKHGKINYSCKHIRKSLYEYKKIAINKQLKMKI